jgi:hypothetical protein
MKHYKAIILFVYLISTLKITNSQVNPTIIIENKVLPSGIYNFCSHNCIISPSSPTNTVAISGTAQVNYTAGNCIHLKPGFSVSALSGGGKFKAQVTPQDFPVVVLEPLTSPTTQVGKFEKLELGLDLPTTIDNLVADYFANGVNPLQINPFNPEDINIVATFISPSGSQNRIVFGFYMEDFERLQDVEHNYSWNPIINEYNFRVRFAPTEEGVWKCDIKVLSPNNNFSPVDVNCIEFTCVPSSNKGYLQVGNHKRHLKYSGTGESFFPIGQNIPWTKEIYNWNDNTYTPLPYVDYYNEVKNLADNQGNFFRMIMWPRSYGLEWEKAGDYGKYIAQDNSNQNRQHQAFELDKLFELCESRNVYMMLDMDFQSSYNLTGVSSVGSFWKWSYNPYHNQLGIPNPTDILFSNVALTHFKNRYRYVLARWGYSTSLGVLELFSEQDGWDNYPGHEADFYALNSALTYHIKNIIGEQNHLLTTSFAVRQANSQWSSNPFSLPDIDLSSTHSYGNKRDENQGRYNEMNETIGNTSNGYEGLLVDYDKPSIFGEIGFMEYDRSSPTGPDFDPNGIEACNDVEFHNAMWSSSFMGCYGVGLNWWQSENDSYRQANFPALNAFFHNIDFESNNFTHSKKWEKPSIPGRNSKCEVFQLRNNNKERIMGWVHNYSNWIGNLVPNCDDGNGNYFYPLNSDQNDDDFGYPHQYTGKLTIQQAKILKKYNIDWYETRNSGALISSVQNWSNLYGIITPDYPGSDWDYAFKASNGSSFHNPEDIPPAYDTLMCGVDSIYIEGTYENDTNGVYNYNWNFGNGQVSSLPHPTVYYTQPGVYSARLIVTDTLGNIDTLEQFVVVPSCDTAQSRQYEQNNLLSNNKNDIIIAPNPNTGIFSVALNDNVSFSIEIYDMYGKLIYFDLNLTERKNINIKEIRAGVYLIRTKSPSGSNSKTLVIQ